QCKVRRVENRQGGIVMIDPSGRLKQPLVWRSGPFDISCRGPSWDQPIVARLIVHCTVRLLEHDLYAVLERKCRVFLYRYCSFRGESATPRAITLIPEPQVRMSLIIRNRGDIRARRHVELYRRVLPPHCDHAEQVPDLVTTDDVVVENLDPVP